MQSRRVIFQAAFTLLVVASLIALIVVSVVVMREYEAAKDFEAGAICRVTGVNYTGWEECETCAHSRCWQTAYPCLRVYVSYVVDNASFDALLYRNVGQTLHVRQISTPLL